MSRVVVNEIEAKVGNDISFNDTVKIDTIKGKTTAGSITVQGENTNTTNLQQGLAKVWINDETLQANSGAVDDSFNIGSTTDNSTGNCTITFTNPFSNDGFSAPYSNSNFANGIAMGKHNSATTSDNVLTWRTSTTVAYTDAAFSGSLHGDLA